MKDMEARQMPLMLAHVLGGGVVGPAATVPSGESEEISVMIIIIMMMMMMMMMMIIGYLWHPVL